SLLVRPPAFPVSAGEGDVAPPDRLAALVAAEDGGEPPAAGEVAEGDGGAPPGEPAVAPGQHGEGHGVEVETLLGEPVLVPGRLVLIGDTLEHAVVGQALQAPGEDVGGDAQAALELVEAPHPVEGLPDHETAPAVAHDPP